MIFPRFSQTARNRPTLAVCNLTALSHLPYNTKDLVLHGNPVQIRSGPATVSVEERGKYATGAAMHWEGSFDPTKREPGDRPSSHRLESTSKGVSMTTLTLLQPEVRIED
jgi:hypothetical protein